MKFVIAHVQALSQLSVNSSQHQGTLPHCWWECKLVQPLWRIVRRFFKKLKIELPYDPGIPFLGIYLEKAIIRKDTCTPCSLQHYVQ